MRKLPSHVSHAADFELSTSVRWGLFVQTPLAVLVVVLSGFHREFPVAWWFVIGMSLVDSICRGFLVAEQFRFYPERQIFWQNLFRASAVLGGAASWGLAVVLWLKTFGLHHPLSGAWLLLIGAVAALAAILHRADLVLAVSYNAVLLFPPTLVFSKSHESGSLVYVVLLAVGFFVLVYVSWSQNQFLVKEQQVRARLMDEHRDRVRAQAAIAHASKLASLGEMTEEIAHEIKNPVAVIDAYAQQLGEEVDKGELTPGKVQEFVERIRNVVRRMDAIIKGLRAYGHRDDQEPFRDVPVAEIVSDTMSFCEWRFKRAGVELRLPKVPPHWGVQCRPVQIGQVLVNLLNNAFDAIQGKFEKPWIEVSVEAHRDSISIAVTDCGAGIPKSVESHLMEAFFTTKNSGQGLGLGLAISNQIVKSHGGTLSVDHSRPHTTFVVKLPCRQGGAPIMKSKAA